MIQLEDEFDSRFDLLVVINVLNAPSPSPR